MEHIGAFGASASLIGWWAMWFIVCLVTSAVLYWLSVTATYADGQIISGIFAVVFHVVVAALGGCLLVTWWSIPSTWAGSAGLWTICGSPVAVAIVLAGPLSGRVIAKKTNI